MYLTSPIFPTFASYVRKPNNQPQFGMATERFYLNDDDLEDLGLNKSSDILKRDFVNYYASRAYTLILQRLGEQYNSWRGIRIGVDDKGIYVDIEPNDSSKNETVPNDHLGRVSDVYFLNHPDEGLRKLQQEIRKGKIEKEQRRKKRHWANLLGTQPPADS